MLGGIVGRDVHGGGGRSCDHLDGHNLAVSAGHTVGLAFGILDDQLEVGHVSGNSVQLEGESAAGADDGAGTRSLDTHEGGRSGESGTAASDDPVVQASEEVGARNLALGTEDGLGLLAQGEFVPSQDLLVRQTAPHGGKPLEHSLYLCLVRGTDTAAVSAVADVLAVLHFRSGHALGAAAHLLKGDGRNVLHSGLGFEVIDNKGHRADNYYYD